MNPQPPRRPAIEVQGTYGFPQASPSVPQGVRAQSHPQVPYVHHRGAPATPMSALNIAALPVGQQPTLATTSVTTNSMELSPRGKHYYPPPSVWTCTGVVAWLGFVLGFVSIIFVLILFFNWNGGPLSSPSARAQFADQLRTQIEERLQERIITGPKKSHVSGSGIKRKALQFELKGKPASFARWPSEEGQIVKEINYAGLVSMRLCCKVKTSPAVTGAVAVVASESEAGYFVCDSGQGATDHNGLEFMLFNVPSQGGAHLMVYMLNESMNGALCTLTWKEK